MNQSKPPFSAADRSQYTWYGRTSAGSPAKVITSTAVGGDLDDLVLAELDRLPGVLDEGGDVGGHEVLPLADPDHQRGVAAGRDHGVRLLRVDRDQGEGTVEPAGRPHASPRSAGARRSTSRPSSWATISVSVCDTGVMPASASSARSGDVVLDDAVVHQGDPAVGGGVRVGVDVGRARRGWPSGCGRSPDRHRGSGSSASSFSRFASLPAFLATSAARRRPPARRRRSRSRGTPAAAALDHDLERRPAGRRTRRFHT